MLVLSRQVEEQILINCGDVKITVKDICKKRESCNVSIEIQVVPESVLIKRHRIGELPAVVNERPAFLSKLSRGERIFIDKYDIVITVVEIQIKDKADHVRLGISTVSEIDS